MLARLSVAVPFTLSVLVLGCLLSSVRADSESILANLTSVELSVYTDRITFLPLNDIVLAYRLFDSTVTVQATMGSVAVNLAALEAESIDFAMSAAALTTAIAARGQSMQPAAHS